MVTLNLDRPPGETIVLRATPEDNAAVPKDQSFSQLTLWLLAVRDQRDREAFADMFDFLAPRLKGFVIRCGARPALAEEIVQDVMLTIWRKAALFDPHKAQASAWIYQIARNRHIDIVRKESRPVPDELGEDPGTEPDASQIIGLEQEAEQLKHAIAQLHPDQKEMIVKAYMGDLTHQEISSQTGLPLGTVKSRIRLGLGRLRKELKGLR
ncbi:sigma-70 family RNA polymerase sigma factor [Leisingera sp. ANG-M7]|uniref:sigma-70 family RNA polymerase sigma factor n=1 Tax=Leisingera sp. ANG-M7 TaxID=1577902 RepID=UPI0009DFB8BA|nr:sigma-70 family RNA polymerase sigma factor [Leisingera sp. ANG-M7]